MKKVLFATTALIATAGMAAADVKLSGYGRFGVEYNEGANREFFITSRFRLNIDGSTTADNGVTFGARVRMQSNGDSTPAGTTPNPALSSARFYAMSGGLTVAVGNILGAIDTMPYLYHGSVGLTGLTYANVVTDFGHDVFNSTGSATQRTGLEVIYKTDMFTLHGSYSDPVGFAPGQQARLAISASGTFNGWTVAAGYQDSNTPTDVEFVVTAGGSVGPAKVSVAYARDHAKSDQFTLGVSADVAAATAVQAYFTHDEARATEEAFGIGFTHGLGGGASLRGGIASVHGSMQGDLGVLFNF